MKTGEGSLRRFIQRIGPFGTDVLLTAGTNIVWGVLTLAAGVLAARLLGPQGRGELAVIQTWPGFIATVAMLGLADALVYFSAREPEQAGRYMGSAMTLALVSSVPFMAGGYLAMPVLLAAQPPEIIGMARWYLLLVPLFALTGMPLHPLRGRNDLSVWNALRLVPSVGWLLVLAAAWLLAKAQPAFVAAGYLAMVALLFFPLMATVVRRVPGPFRPQWQRGGPMLRYGLPSMVGNLPQMLNLRLDQMLMAALLPAQVLGLYVVAVTWSSSVQLFLNALASVLFPRVASAPDRERHRVFAQGTRLGAFLSIVATAVLMPLTPGAILVLFGQAFAPAVAAALLLVVAGAVAGLNQIIEEGLRGLGHPGAVMRAEFGGLAVTAILLALLLRPLGIVGAALTSLLGYSTVTALLVVQARRLTGQPPAVLLCPSPSELASSWQRVKALREVMVK